MNRLPEAAADMPWWSRVSSSTVSAVNTRTYGNTKPWRCGPINGEHSFVYCGRCQTETELGRRGVQLDRGHLRLLYFAGQESVRMPASPAFMMFFMVLKYRGLCVKWLSKMRTKCSSLATFSSSYLSDLSRYMVLGESLRRLQ